MATMTLTIGANTKSWTVSAGDITRIIDAYRILYQNPVMTSTQVFDRIAADFAREIKSNTKRSEGKTAVDAAPEVTLT